MGLDQTDNGLFFSFKKGMDFLGDFPIGTGDIFKFSNLWDYINAGPCHHLPEPGFKIFRCHPFLSQKFQHQRVQVINPDHEKIHAHLVKEGGGIREQLHIKIGPAFKCIFL